MKNSSILLINILLFNFILIVFSTSCNQKEDNVQDTNYTVFTLLDSSETGINFINSIIESPEDNLLTFEYMYNGGGVGVGDFNNNGLPDLFFAGNMTGNRLYRNIGDMKFEDITDEAGVRGNKWYTGVSVVDINKDGLLDIYVCVGGPSRNTDELKNELYINKGDGTFIESAEQYGLAGYHRSSQASFFDYNNDGHLDVFVINYPDEVFKIRNMDQEESESPEKKASAASSVLYKNNGDGTFTDVTKEAGILRQTFGLGLITSDFNGDGLIDIYVSNDYLTPNYLFINQGDGTFRDEIRERLDHCSYFSMGVDFADINNDGLQDIFELDMMPDDHILGKTHMQPMDVDLFFEVVKKGLIPQYMFNSLHIQHGFGYFTDIAQMAGVAKTDWSWSSLMADYNNNGWKDNFVSNGYRRNINNNDFMDSKFPKIQKWRELLQLDSLYQVLLEYPGYPQVNYVYQNMKDLTFRDVSKEWGFDIPTYSNGAVYADLDLDGDLDLIISNIDQPAFIYRNNTSEKSQNNWIRFKLTDIKNNLIPFNAKVEIVRENGEVLIEELITCRGYLSSTEPILHFGLGNQKKLDKVRIIWSDRSVSYIDNPEVNKVHKIDKGDIEGIRENPKSKLEYFFKDLSFQIFNEEFLHREDDYHDYDTEVLLPYKQSALGPLMGHGDATGNGLQDFFVGGAKGQAGVLYLMGSDNLLYKAPCQPWEAQAGSEDMGSVFFDVDGDGDLDLYIVSGGGGEFKVGDPLLQDRLYLNNGKGCFTGPIVDALPSTNTSGGRVVTADFDGDGLSDLFVTGRTNPGRYPYPGTSYLLHNHGGVMKDVTEQWLPGLKDIGMVTDAIFHDFDGDGKLDLLICGEWMTLKLFIQGNKKFEDKTEEWGLHEKTGWWYSLALVDVNNDGKMDVVAGNIGLNNKFNFKAEKPLYVFADDFDQNGTVDIVLSKDYKGKLVPVRGRQCSSDQMPFIKDKYPTYAQFASASLQDIYGEEQLDSSLNYKANESRSMVWLNKGKKFEPIPLPNAAQMGPVLKILVIDANGDEFPDLLIGGDIADTEPETPAFDGGTGLLLTGNGDGNFNPVWFKNSGFRVTSKNVKDMILIPSGNKIGQMIIVSGNNSYLQALQFFGKY